MGRIMATIVKPATTARKRPDAADEPRVSMSGPCGDPSDRHLDDPHPEAGRGRPVERLAPRIRADRTEQCKRPGHRGDAGSQAPHPEAGAVSAEPVADGRLGVRMRGEDGCDFDGGDGAEGGIVAGLLLELVASYLQVRRQFTHP